MRQETLTGINQRRNSSGYRKWYNNKRRGSNRDCCKLVKKTFNAENHSNFSEIPPKEMKHPFTGEEVNKAIKSLKNNKSAGIDNITAEQLKYDPKEINEGIAEILNSTAKTGK